MFRNRALRVLLLIATLLVADRLLGTIISDLAQKQIRDNRVGFLVAKKLHPDIFILGSSRALNNYDPSIIQERTGMSCYNLGVSGSNILFHETLLDLVLMDSVKPKCIIYNIDDYGTLFSIDGIIYRKDILFPYVDNDFVNEKVSSQVKRNVIATKICSTYRENVNFINALKFMAYGREAPDYKTTNIAPDGSNLLEQRPSDPVPVFGERKKHLDRMIPDPELADAFRRIQQKCLDKGITLVLVLPPLYTAPSYYFRKVVKESSLPGVHWLDYTGQMQQQEYFFNPDHMNRTGAQVFSEKVSAELISLLR